MDDCLKYLEKAFQQWAGQDILRSVPLPSSGSERKYWRLVGHSSTAIGVYHPVKEESHAFQEFTRHFLQSSLRVPEIYYIDPNRDIYLLQDLGDNTLFSLLQERKGDSIPASVIEYYKTSLDELVKFQVLAKEGLDFSVCHPRSSFDRQSIAWDLNYFKYNFLKLESTFNEQELEQDFQKLTDFLLEAHGDYFMYRDFQARNIMIHEGYPYFIDYQGGRRGPLQYDPVSLLFQVKADLPVKLREELLSHYLRCLGKVMNIDEENFLKYYEGFILLRLMQVLGAYGFRGLIQKKPHFIASLPYAMKTLRWFLGNNTLPIDLPELFNRLEQLAHADRYSLPLAENELGLTVAIQSFSYKHGIPEDYSGHGGGFVFDCRALPNPGREESLRDYTGLDRIIIDYLDEKKAVADFLDNVYHIVDQAVENYTGRKFNHLSVFFGCTGGQHRSVYSAEALARHLQNNFSGLSVSLVHRELDKMK